MNNLSIYNEIVKSRGLRKLDYQEEFLTSEYNSTKPFVLAAGTSSGKTFMAIMKLEIFYSFAENKNKRTLIIPYAMKVLRDNFSDELNGFKPSFTYCVATTKDELIACLKSDCQVVVALPQSLENSIDLLPTFHNFIIDEAHQWYGKKTINTILKKIKPKYQLLLTGTPARFIAKGDSFNFQFVPVMHLFGLKQVTNVRIEVVSSTYDFKQSDYQGRYGNLKGGKITKKNTDEALVAVCKEMLKRIKNPIKQPNLSRVTKDVLSVFNQIGKTIVFCHSVKQADAIYNSLNGFKDLTGKVLVSHSKNDPNSENFITFKDNDSYSILVAVDRGKLGFNIPELFNVVDFTLTQSLDMLMQMFGRVLRLSKTDKPKTYYKVSTKNTAPYYVDLMTAMLCLTDMEWYSKYNGKNMDGILIPKVLTNTKSKYKSSVSKTVKKSTKPKVSLADLDIPLDMNLFKNVYHNHNDKFGTVSFTTLGDCRVEFNNLNPKIWLRDFWDFEKARTYVHSLGLKNQGEWQEYAASKDRHPNIPSNAARVYCDKWVSLADWLGNGHISAFEVSKNLLNYEEAKRYIKKFKFKSYPQYREYVINNNIEFLPKSPKLKYNRTGEWKGYSDFFGTVVVANQDKKFLPYNEAKLFVSKLKLKNRDEWNAYKKSGKKPSNIANDKCVYGDDWKGWGDFLGTNNSKF